MINIRKNKKKKKPAIFHFNLDRTRCFCFLNLFFVFPLRPSFAYYESVLPRSRITKYYCRAAPVI